MTTHAFGIDIGGTGTKGAPVDLDKGELTGDRNRYDTPKPATPLALVDIVSLIIGAFPAEPNDCPVGVAIPAIVQHGVARSAANIDETWIDTDVDKLFTSKLGRSVHVVNDADAAGVAEARYGAARDVPGLVCVLTLGTGIGSALLIDGILVPNTEFGHLEFKGGAAEKYAASSVRERENLSWEDWAKRLRKYFTHVERLVSPDLFVIGGGVSKNSEKFLPLLDIRTPIIPAQHRNNAGIIGAAALAADETH